MARLISVLAVTLALASACSRGGPEERTNLDETPTQAASAAQQDPAPQTQPAPQPAPSQAAAATADPKPSPAAATPPEPVTTPTSERANERDGATSPEPTPKAVATAGPAFREVTIPAGRTIRLRLTTSVASDTSRTEDPVSGTLTRALVVAGTTAVPAGSEVSGTVLATKRSGRVKGRASVAFRFNRLVVRDEGYTIRTARVTRQAAGNKRKDVARGGIGAGVGAIVGGVVGGGRGAAIGAGAGGTGAVLATRGEEVRLPAGTLVTTTLQEPLRITVPVVRK